MAKKKKKHEKRQHRARGEAHLSPNERGRGFRVAFTLTGVGQLKPRFADEEAAQFAVSQANKVLRAIREGLVDLPTGLSKKELAAWVTSGGSGRPKPTRRPGPANSVVEETSSALIQRFRKAKAPGPAFEESSYITLGIHLNHFKRFLDEVGLLYARVDDISLHVMLDYQSWRMRRALAHTQVVKAPAKRRKAVKESTVNKETATISSLFGFSRLRENPCKSLRTLPEDEAPDFRTQPEIEAYLAAGVFSTDEETAIRKARILTLEEIEQLLALVKGYAVHVPLAIAAYCGARRSEIARLTCAHVDFRNSTITFASKKQSRRKKATRRRVEIHPRLLPILQAHRLKVGGRGYLFPGTSGHVSKSTMHGNLVRVVKETHFQGIGWHTLRHSMASNLARAGVDQRVINDILGHVSNEMARRYRHLFPDQRHGAMQQLVLSQDLRAAQ